MFFPHEYADLYCKLLQKIMISKKALALVLKVLYAYQSKGLSTIRHMCYTAPDCIPYKDIKDDTTVSTESLLSIHSRNWFSLKSQILFRTLIWWNLCKCREKRCKNHQLPCLPVWIKVSLVVLLSNKERAGCRKQVDVAQRELQLFRSIVKSLSCWKWALANYRQSRGWSA